MQACGCPEKRMPLDMYLLDNECIVMILYSQKDAIFVKFMTNLLHVFTKRCYFCEK
jgi:hypothetical protein